MQLVLSTLDLQERAGTQSYLLVVAVELQRLGHDVVVHAENVIEGERRAEQLGLRMAVGRHGLPEAPDAIFAQDAAMAYQLAERYPSVPQLFLSHSAVHDLQFPPQLAGVVAGVVVMNDRIAERMGAMAADLPVTRLRQPVAYDQFAAPGPLPRRARRLLAMTHRLTEARRAPLMEACEALGIEYTEIGRRSEVSDTPAMAIEQADIVVGYGRCIVEAMAAGRAAYVYDYQGADGWVTAESYAALEADGFAGSGRERPVRHAADLRRDLEAYDPEMGAVNRGLVLRHHTAAAHAVQVADLLEGLVGGPRPPELAGELARLIRENWRRESYHLQLGVRLTALESELGAAEAARDELRERLSSDVRDAEQRVRAEADLELAAERARLEAAHEQLAALERTAAEQLEAESERRMQLERQLEETVSGIEAFKRTRRYRAAALVAGWLDRRRTASGRPRG